MSPLRHKFIHERLETVIVTPFEQVDHFVDENVFQALRRLLREFEVETDAAGFGVAGAPIWFSSVGYLIGLHKPATDQMQIPKFRKIAITDV